MARDNPEFVRQSDDAFYDNHDKLVVDGRRQKLSALDPEQEELREEWRRLYDAAAAEAGEAEEEEEEPGANTNKPAQGVEGCPNNDWISIALLRKNDLEPYEGETVDATLTDGTTPSETLGGDGSRLFSGIPCGSCSFRFPDFYGEIEAWITEQIEAWNAARAGN